MGRQVAALLDTETNVAGVTSGTPRPELAHVGALRHAAGGNLNPASGDLELRAGWGHKGSGGVTMPGRGRIVKRPYNVIEREPLKAKADADFPVSFAAFCKHLGLLTCDVYLNDSALWSNVPARVWEYTIGGYQVIKKWLSYREFDNLNRALTVQEAREVTSIVRRIAALLLLEDELNSNYVDCKSKTGGTTEC